MLFVFVYKKKKKENSQNKTQHNLHSALVKFASR